MHGFRERVSIGRYSSFSFAFEGWMFDLIELIPEHCLSIYFPLHTYNLNGCLGTIVARVSLRDTEQSDWIS